MLLFLGILGLASCKDPDHPKPEITPCFSIVADSFRDPRAPVQFVNCSDGTTEYFWDFGDGKSSTEANPSHTYTTTGYFDVRLEAKKNRRQESLEKQIRVDYPQFKAVRVMQLPVISPRSGQPLDQGAPGLDLAFSVIKLGDNFSSTGALAYGIQLPRELPLPNEVGINGTWSFYFR